MRIENESVLFLFVPYAHKETKFKGLNMVCPFTARDNDLPAYKKYNKNVLRSVFFLNQNTDYILLYEIQNIPKSKMLHSILFLLSTE